MSGIWSVRPRICTVSSYHQGRVAGICYWFWKCWSSRHNMVGNSDLHFHRWALLDRAGQGGWCSIILSSYIPCPGILCPPNQEFGTIEECRGSNYCRKSSYSIQHLNIGKILHRTQLSFIQLGGGIVVGVEGKQKNRYSLFYTPEMRVAKDTTVAVRTTTLQICSQLTSPHRYGILGQFCAISLLPSACPIMWVPAFLLSSDSFLIHEGSCPDMIPPSRRWKQFWRKLSA